MVAVEVGITPGALRIVAGLVKIRIAVSHDSNNMNWFKLYYGHNNFALIRSLFDSI